MNGEFVFVDIKTPFEGAVVKMNRWWHMKDGKGVFYRSNPKSQYLAPQCNQQETVVRALNKKDTWKEFDVELVPVAYVKSYAN